MGNPMTASEMLAIDVTKMDRRELETTLKISFELLNRARAERDKLRFELEERYQQTAGVNIEEVLH